MGIRGRPSVPVGVCGHPWASADVRGWAAAGTPWAFIGAHGHPRACPRARGRLWECPWAPMDAHGYVHWSVCSHARGHYSEQGKTSKGVLSLVVCMFF